MKLLDATYLIQGRSVRLVNVELGVVRATWDHKRLIIRIAHDEPTSSYAATKLAQWLGLTPVDRHFTNSMLWDVQNEIYRIAGR